MSNEKRYIRGRTESGDYYSATVECWQAYRAAVAVGDEETMLHFEEGNDDDFYYDPQEEQYD